MFDDNSFEKQSFGEDYFLFDAIIAAIDEFIITFRRRRR